MDYEYFEPAILWREGNYHCELWKTENGSELRLYSSHVLTYREPVRNGTGGLRQAAALLASVQAEQCSGARS